MSRGGGGGLIASTEKGGEIVCLSMGSVPARDENGQSGGIPGGKEGFTIPYPPIKVHEEKRGGVIGTIYGT